MTPEPYLSIWRHETVRPRCATRVTMAEVAKRVAEKHKLSVEDLKGPERARRVSWPRQEAMHEIQAATAQSLPAIGRFLGGRDHTTVLWGIRRHEERLQKAGEATHG